MELPYDQVHHLALTDRSRKRRQTAARFLCSMYSGEGVCLHDLRAFPDDQRGGFVRVLEDYLSDPRRWILAHRPRVQEVQKTLSK